MADIIGSNFIKLSRVDSTNNYATEYLTHNDWKEGTVIIADEQFGGRGQINNSWESEAKRNILMSIILSPEFLPIQYQFLLSKVVVIGISEVLSLYADYVKVKWPNDIYVGDKKIAGILIENSIMGSRINSSVVGIGLNVNQKEFVSDAPNPVSLIQLLGKQVDCDCLLVMLLNAIDKWYNFLRNGELEKINVNYLKHLYRFGNVELYEDVLGEFYGTIVGVNEIGQLQIEKATGELISYHFKEVKFKNY